MKSIKIEGMSCQHCVAAVTSALGELGLKGVAVDLEGGSASFEESGSVSADAIREAIEDAGFEVVL